MLKYVGFVVPVYFFHVLSSARLSYYAILQIYIQRFAIFCFYIFNSIDKLRPEIILRITVARGLYKKCIL